MSAPGFAVPEAIFFDVDGVLIDSLGVKGAAFANLFPEAPERHHEIVSYHMAHGGTPRSEKLAAIFALVNQRDPSKVELAGLVDAFARDVVDNVVAAPEILGASAALKRWSLRTDLHAVSATPTDELRRILDARGMTSVFTSVSGWPPKKSALINHQVATRGYVAARCVLVGDSRQDLSAASESGTAFVHLQVHGSTALKGAAFTIPDLTNLDAAIAAVMGAITQ